MIYRMYGTVEFDREIDPDKHYISPGGYEAKFNDGRTLQFDFEDYEGGRQAGNSKVLEWTQKNPDTSSFEEIGNFTYKDFVKHFEDFEEFFIYTGEAGEPEINPVKALDVTLEFYENDEIKIFKVPKDKLPIFGIEIEHSYTDALFDLERD